MHTLLTTFKTKDNNSIKLLYGVLGSRLFLLNQDYDVTRLRNVAKKCQGFDGFELRSGRGQVVERWEYLHYGTTEKEVV